MAVIYVSLVILMVSIASAGYQPPIEKHTANSIVSASQQPMITNVSPTVDQIVAADMAASAAQIANLAIANNVSSLSISMNAKSELSQTDDSVLSKPQIVQTNTDRRGITNYTVTPTDNLTVIAQKFGVSTQTLRWANQMTSDNVSSGRVLLIPGVDGVVYTVKSSDTLDSIAGRYKSDKQRIVTYNDLELSGVVEGMKIVLPDGTLPETERPGYTTPTTTKTYYSPSVLYTGTVFAGNGYAYGYCTWYAYNRRVELGHPVGSNWGNASTWAGYARGAGFLVDSSPGVGAVVQTSSSYAGHVAVVESVDGNGNVTISEMNYAGWNKVTTRTLSASQARAYNYIH
jgi:surface antigen